MAYEDEFNIRKSGDPLPNPSLRELKGAEFENYGKGPSHDDFFPTQPPKQIDTLRTQNENKDFFELMKGMMPSMDTVENFIGPIGGIKLLQLFNQSPSNDEAFLKGLGQSAFGEPDPVGPQGLPFSQFMQQKKALDPKVKSIVDQHVNGLFKK
mgnify:CR=1 FL=1|tara:strand:+ start:1047 stop:1505 length:459 start_codon:yes stop_codon:yes gene_type:complete